MNQIRTRKITKAIKCNQRFFVMNPKMKKINAIIAVTIIGVVMIAVTSFFISYRNNCIRKRNEIRVDLQLKD